MNTNELARAIDIAIGTRPEALFDLLDALQDACNETAQHARSMWEDDNIAACWESAANAIALCEVSVQKHLSRADVGKK